MTPFFWRKLSPATRVAIGLVSLTLSLVLLADVFVTFLPDRLADAKRRHATAASLVATQISAALRDGDGRGTALQKPLALALQHEPQLAAAAVVSADGQPLASAGDMQAGWTLQASERSTVDNVRAPIFQADRPWGELRLVFKPTQPRDLAGWLRDPLVRGLLLVALLGFVSFQLYLRRVLRYLDPDAAVPERVRTAFDTLTEAVLVMDADGNILMANQPFRELQPGFTDYLTGASIDSLAWLTAGLPESADMAPWRIAMERNVPSLGHDVVIEVPGQRRRRLVMNCSPINDGDSKARGCLTTFSDVTDLEERTEHLRQTLVELSASQAEIEQKNKELVLLATRDALTGCLNRGSFMAETDQRFAEAKAHGTPACVVMCDIDHFKQVNDKYGHAGGDRVIQAAVKAITRGLRVGDLLGRYGGEEFCIMLPGATLAQTLEIAERLRADVEANVGDAIREPANVKVTMSFGVAQLHSSTPDPATLIDLADQALYLSKKGGRNRVTSEAALRAARTEPQTV
jgi:diguanylate cyclase (GGDEF)-like protein